MAKLDILVHLAGVPDATAADVGHALGLSLPTTGMMLLRLARSGLVVRAVDPHDRCYYYSLTPRGRARLDFFLRAPH